MAGGDDDTARKLQRLQDYNPGHDQSQHPPQPHPQQLPPVQRTHAGFQHAMSPPTAENSAQHPAASPHTPHHHQHQLPPMVDPALGGGNHQLAPIQTPPGPPQHMQAFPQTPESAQDAADRQKGRTLSNTKRAAQNRAAQRAFRQRKEIHIKNLENRVGELEPLKRQLHSLQQDNYALRGYLINMLEMCATKGYEIPPGMPSMQNLQSEPPPPLQLDSPLQDPQQDSDPAGSQLHAQQEQYQSAGGDAEMSGAGQGGPSDQEDNAGVPTAPMQDIAQQAMDHGGVPGRAGAGSSGNARGSFAPLPTQQQADAVKQDSAGTGA